MAERTTFIKLDRNIQRWRWYQDGNTFRVFVHLLIKANVSDCDFQTITVHRGQLVTSIRHLANEIGISQKAVRVALGHLEETHEVAKSSNSKYTVITVLNYDAYQNRAQSTANKGQAKGKQRANEGQQYKNNKNISSNEDIKNDKNTAEPIRRVYADGLPPMTEEELQAHIRGLREQD